MEMAAYVGDVLSFYQDNQFQETFIQYARETSNLYDLAYMFGYKPRVTATSTTNIDFYQQVPAIWSSGQQIPDYDYAVTIPANTQIQSQNNSNINFIIEDPVNFAVSSSMDPTTVSVYKQTGGVIDYFLLKKTRKAQSAIIFIIHNRRPPVLQRAGRLRPCPGNRRGHCPCAAAVVCAGHTRSTQCRRRVLGGGGRRVCAWLCV